MLFLVIKQLTLLFLILNINNSSHHLRYFKESIPLRFWAISIMMVILYCWICCFVTMKTVKNVSPSILLIGYLPLKMFSFILRWSGLNREMKAHLSCPTGLLLSLWFIASVGLCEFGVVGRMAGCNRSLNQPSYSPFVKTGKIKKDLALASDASVSHRILPLKCTLMCLGDASIQND